MMTTLDRALMLLSGDAGPEDRAQLEDPGSELSRLLGAVRDCSARTEVDTLFSRNSDAAARLEEAKEALGASSCTFYVHDPWWPGEGRLLLMPGVRYREPMHGFVFPGTARSLLNDGDAELFVPNACKAGWHDDDLSIPLSELDVEEEVKPLFERFAKREGVQSSARLLHRLGDDVHAALFLNFDRRVRFTASLKQRIRAVMADMLTFLPGISRELQTAHSMSAAQVVRILQPVRRLAGFGLQGDETSLGDCLDAILKACCEAFHLSPETGLGTIHLYEQETGTLRLAASNGRIDRPELARAQSVYKGEGIISWVALKRRPLLIEDLPESEFRRISRDIRDGVRSELAVPMLAGERILGVVNLESIHPRAFSSQSVRVICHAAERAATATFLHQQIALNHERAALAERLLGLSHAIAASRGSASVPLDELATIACDSLKASICDVWHFNTQKGKFDAAGTTDPVAQMSSGPRKGGWSDYIRDTGCYVWITNVMSEKQFDAFVWNASGGMWKPLPAGSGAPRSVNPHLLTRNVQCELGVPITVGKDLAGVAWLKYENAKAVPAVTTLVLMESLVGAALVLYKSEEKETLIPSIETMSLVRRFTENAAKVMDPLLYRVG